MITRLRLADDETMAIEWLHAPRSLLPDLRREELATTPSTSCCACAGGS